MSRRSVLSAVRPLHLCELCGEEVSHDVVRIDEGRLYHLRCFRMHVSGGEAAICECPGCSTLGRSWDWVGKHWRTCAVCNGSGYLAPSEEACGY
jgi:hypothetical protein